MKRFVIVVDMQRDFIAADGALPVAGAEAIVSPMKAWLAGLRSEDVAGVLFTADTHVPAIYAASAEAEQFPPHCEKGTPGWENVLDPDAIDPAVPVYRLEKGVFDMWAEPDLEIAAVATGEQVARDAFFAELKARGVSEVTVVGVAADYCVRWAIEGLVARGFAVEVPMGLTRGIARRSSKSSPMILRVRRSGWRRRHDCPVASLEPLQSGMPVLRLRQTSRPVTKRLSQTFYLMTEHNFDVAPDILPPGKQQLVLLNRDEVVNARTTARKLSIDAIERASR